MNHEEPTKRILLTGATGYVGGRLLPVLRQGDCRVRCLVRDPARLAKTKADNVEIATGDVRVQHSLEAALTGVDVAYYLIHLMGDSSHFQKEDREAARTFSKAAKDAGVKRIVYLGGLGDETDPKLSPHLKSRQEVGKILRDSGIETIEFRASVVIGKGSLSFELVKSLTERLPIMICPSWLSTPTQPIAICDVVSYLHAALDLPEAESRVYEIGGEDVITYGGLIKEYARLRKLRRLMIKVPILSPRLSSLWLGLVTPATAGVGRHLIEGLKNPTVVTNDRARQDFPITPKSIQQAIAAAIEEDRSGQH